MQNFELIWTYKKITQILHFASVWDLFMKELNNSTFAWCANLMRKEVWAGICLAHNDPTQHRKSWMKGPQKCAGFRWDGKERTCYRNSMLPSKWPWFKGGMRRHRSIPCWSYNGRFELSEVIAKCYCDAQRFMEMVTTWWASRTWAREVPAISVRF